VAAWLRPDPLGELMRSRILARMGAYFKSGREAEREGKGIPQGQGASNIACRAGDAG